jgi:hypothetical protein
VEDRKDKVGGNNYKEEEVDTEDIEEFVAVDFFNYSFFIILYKVSKT